MAWTGRRAGRRQYRRWAKAWSPEQIASRLRRDFPEDETMRVSHEAIYQSLHVQGRGALKRELTACLRRGRALRLPRSRLRGRGKSFVTPEAMISERPAEATDRAVPGHWEGDLILGLGSSAIGTLVERATRFTMLLHLPRMSGHGDGEPVRNGPALAGHGAEAVRNAIARKIATLSPSEIGPNDWPALRIAMIRAGKAVRKRPIRRPTLRSPGSCGCPASLLPSPTQRARSLRPASHHRHRPSRTAVS